MVRALINLNNGHTPRSPGGVWGGRTEYGEMRRLIEAVSRRLEGFPVKITEGGKVPYGDDLVVIFHKGTTEKNGMSGGADITVPENASARTQYNAYRLLLALCGETGLRYRGVHTATAKSPFGSLRLTENENAYLIRAGFIDCDRDNALCEGVSDSLAAALSQEIIRIYKEKMNENYS